MLRRLDLPLWKESERRLHGVTLLSAEWGIETIGHLGKDGTTLIRDLVTTAAARGLCSPHAVTRWRCQLQRLLVAAEGDTKFRALSLRAGTLSGRDTVLCSPSLQHGNVQ